MEIKTYFYLLKNSYSYNVLWFTQVDFLINVGSNFRYPVTLKVMVLGKLHEKLR